MRHILALYQHVWDVEFVYKGLHESDNIYMSVKQIDCLSNESIQITY